MLTLLSTNILDMLLDLIEKGSFGNGFGSNCIIFGADMSSSVHAHGLNGYVYDFSVDCDAIAVDDILDIHKYLMKKNGI